MEYAKKTCSPLLKVPIEKRFTEQTKDFDKKNEVLHDALEHPTFEELSTLRQEVAFLLNFSKQYAQNENDNGYRFRQQEVADILEMSLDSVKFHYQKAKKQY